MPPASKAALRNLVRQALAAGTIPNRRPDRTWGRPGVGAPCSICGDPVPATEMEYEVQFARDGKNPGLDNFHVHTRGAAVWELERCRRRPKTTRRKPAK